MATVSPLAVNPATGNPKTITPPDTIDPAVLPASGSATPTLIAAGTTYTVAAGTQVLWAEPITILGQKVLNGVMRAVT